MRHCGNVHCRRPKDERHLWRALVVFTYAERAHSVLRKKFAYFAFSLFGFQQIVQEATAAAFAAGAVSFFIALGAGFSALLNLRRTMQACLLGVLAVSAAEIGIGVVIKNNVNGVVDGIIADAENGVSIGVAGTATWNIIHFQQALFDQCCASKNWSRENPPPGYVPDSGPSVNYVYLSNFFVETPPHYYIPPCVTINDSYVCAHSTCPLGSNWATKEASYQSCVEDQDTYRIYNYTAVVNKDLICGIFSKVTVDITGLELKKINIANALFEGITTMPLVGNSSNPNFGCAGGFSLGFQGMMLLWAEQESTPLSLVCIISGAIQVVLLLLSLFASLYMSGASKSESSAAAYDRYQKEVLANSTREGNGFPDSARLAPDSARLESNRMSTSSKASGMGGYNIREVANPSYVNPMHVNQAQVFNVDDKI